MFQTKETKMADSPQTGAKASTKRRAAPSYATYIPKVLKSVYDGGIEEAAKQQLRVVVEDLADRIAQQARQLTVANDRKTVSDLEVKTAVQLILGGGLADNAIDDATMAIESYDATDSGPKVVRAGLIVPPSLAEKNIRDHSNLRVSEKAGVYLAAVMEHLIADMTERAGKEAQEDKRKRITVRQLYLAISSDEELKKVVKTELLGGGVLPYIHSSLEPKEGDKKKRTKKRSKKGSAKTTGPKPHRFRAGTVALRKIKKYQKSTDLLLPKEQFRRVVRSINIDKKTGKDLSKDKKTRFSNEALDDLQKYVEQALVKWIKAANLIGVEFEHMSLTPRALDLAKEIAMGDHMADTSMVTNKAIAQVSQPGLQRLAQRAGVKRITGQSYDNIREGLALTVTQVLRPSVTIGKSEGKRTLTPKILRLGAMSQGISLAI